MNKKVLTLCAGFLLAGSLATLDAKITIPANGPEVGGSYVLATAFTEATGQQDNWMQPDLTRIQGGEIATFGTEWTFESAGNGAFYLKSAKGKYITFDVSFNAKLVEKKADAIALVYDKTNGVISPAKNGSGEGANCKTTDFFVWDVANSKYILAATGASAPNYLAVKAAEFTAPTELGDNLLMESVGDDYYFIGNASGAGDAATVSALHLKDDGTVELTTAPTSTTGSDYDAYLWKVSKSVTANNGITYTFTSKVDPTKAFAYTTDVEYKNGFNLNGVPGAASGNIFGLYRSPLLAQAGATLNDFLGEGFELTVKVNKDSDIQVELMNALSGTLTAVKADGNKYVALEDDDTETQFKIKSGNKFLVLNPTKKTGINTYEGVFELVTKKEMEENEDYASNFQLLSYYGEDQNVIARMIVSDDAGNDYYTYVITTSANKTRAYLTATTDDVLETGEAWPYITLGANNYVKAADLLGKYWNFSFTGEAETGESYKNNGVLVTNEEVTSATYVKANTVLLTSPEAQWGVTAVSDETTFTLTNRESGVSIENVRLRLEDGVYTIASADADIVGDEVKLTANEIKGTKHFDGFMTANETELRNTVFHIGQYHNETGNSTAFWTENHQSEGSHKLGVVTDEDEAVNWTLRLDKQLNNKGKETAKIDTVYVITKLAGVKDGKIQNELTPDTLAILPYQFQNKGNLEYVVLGNDGKTYFYQCQEDYSWEGEGDAPEVKKGVEAKAANRFALKMKPNNTYNIITLAGNGAERQTALGTVKGESKVWVANSEQWGSIKNMAIYGEENNSLMQIIPVDRPEYRKLVSEAGSDTIRIYLEENNSQVVYEKKDAKSVVEKDTLSFLNIDNVEQFKDINPAIFADTAYVNRTIEGVANKCYQYLLAVDVEKKLDTFCPEDMSHNDPEWIAEHGVCPHAIKTPYVKARYLVNLIDTANIYGKTHLHNNPYINQSEEGAEFAKLAFVPGFHVGDSLYLVTNDDTVTVDLSTPEFNVAKFAFKYEDVNAGSFKIQTLYKEYNPDAAEKDRTVSQEGYLRYVNGCLVVDNGYSRGYIFNMNEDETRTPTANESITAEGAVSVVATDGAVVIKGAEGKNVVIATILGKVVANETINSDNETIAVPAGIAVVSVDGESFKVVVK